MPDFHKMWMRWAERHVKGPIHTHSKVIRISRFSVLTYSECSCLSKTALDTV